MVLWCSKPKGRGSIPAGPRALLRSFQSGRNRLGRMKKVLLFSNWHGGVMVQAVVYEAQGGEDRFPAGPRALLSWFQSGRKGLGSCNRFEKLNKQLLTAYFEVIQEHFFREVTFSIFDQRDGEKDDVTMVKRTKYAV